MDSITEFLRDKKQLTRSESRRFVAILRYNLTSTSSKVNNITTDDLQSLLDNYKFIYDNKTIMSFINNVMNVMTDKTTDKNYSKITVNHNIEEDEEIKDNLEFDDFIVDDDYIEYDDGTINSKTKSNIVNNDNNINDTSSTTTTATNSDEDYDDGISNICDIVHISRKRKRELGLDNVPRNVVKDIYKRAAVLKMRHDTNKIDMCKVLTSNFDDDDNDWFYKQFNRLELVEGIDRFRIYDNIESRYKKLIALKNSELYDYVNDKDSVIDRITKSGFPKKIKSILVNKIIKVNSELPEEYHKLMMWYDTVLKIPLDTQHKNINNNVNNVVELKRKLDNNLYGIKNVKTRFLEAYVSNYKTNNGCVIGLVGPPGIGKTTLASLLADQTGMGFGIVPCGQIKDKAFITGHGSTYIGAEPGILTRIMINNGTLYNVIVLDELCKMSPELIPIFMGILDFGDSGQNKHFVDEYCPEVPIDLSKNIFIVTMNSTENVNEALLNRMKLIHMKGYEYEAKYNILRNHIVPKMKKKSGLKCNIASKALATLIKTFSPDVSGVRRIIELVEMCYDRIELIKSFVDEYGDPESERSFEYNNNLTNTSTTTTRSKKKLKMMNGRAKSITLKLRNGVTPRHGISAVHDYINDQLDIRIPTDIDLYNIQNINSINTELMLSLIEVD